MIPANSFDQPIAYIDLDLPRSKDEDDHDSVFSNTPSSSGFGGPSSTKKRSPRMQKTSETIYDKVDFTKTEAFNRTKREQSDNRAKHKESFEAKKS